MKKTFYIGLICLTLFGAAACGAASAPPVELPAPVVGRITVGAPDATGKSTIVGTEGAVTGGAIVMAINERLATTSLLWEISDALIPAAYAQALPAICSTAGHVCTVAQSDGSFVMSIDAIVGDNIIIVLIDETGAEISERISVVVPDLSSGGEVLTCASSAVSGSLVDVAILDHAAMTLFEGSADRPNRIVQSGSEFLLPGCFAKKIISFRPDGRDYSQIVAISSGDSTETPYVWTAKGFALGTASINYFSLPSTIEPLGVASIGVEDQVALAFETGGRLVLGKLSLASGEILSEQTVPNPSGTAFSNLVALKTIGPFGDGAYLILVVFSASDGTYHAMMFESRGLVDVSSLALPFSLNSELSLNSGDVISDALLYFDLSEYARVVFVNNTNGYLYPRNIVTGAAHTQVTRSFALANVAEANFFVPAGSAIFASSLSPLHPNKITVGYDATGNPYVYTSVTDDQTHVLRVDVSQFNVTLPFVEEVSITSTIIDPIAIAYDYTGTADHMLFVADEGAGTAVNVSEALVY